LFVFLVAFSVSAEKLKAYFAYCTFNSPQSGPYVETYLSIMGNSVAYQLAESGIMQGSIEVTFVFKQDGEVKNFKKYNLLSPEVSDSAKAYKNFIDQQRISLPNGAYELEIQIKDNNTDDKPFRVFQEVVVDYPDNKITISDIELFESHKEAKEQTMLTKSGYDLVPYVSDFYPKSVDKISFYAEIYNTHKILGNDEPYLLNFYIESYETGVIVNNLRSFKKQTAKQVNVLLNKFNINNLPSGNYNLTIEVKNKTNQLLASKKLFFQKSNPDLKIKAEDIARLETASSFVESITDKEKLRSNIGSLAPISTEIERNFQEHQLKNADIRLMQQYFLSFWQTRDQLNPGSTWRKYKDNVDKAQELFATSIKNGYETDRGRIYLRHGVPNTVITRDNEPSSYPYKIWHYYKAGNQSNVKFVFYNPDLVSNDYELLHSNLRGEVNDYRWQYRLQNRNTPNTNLDEEKGIDHFGNRPEDYYNTPR